MLPARRARWKHIGAVSLRRVRPSLRLPGLRFPDGLVEHALDQLDETSARLRLARVERARSPPQKRVRLCKLSRLGGIVREFVFDCCPCRPPQRLVIEFIARLREKSLHDARC